MRAAIAFVFQGRKENEALESVQVDRSHFGFLTFFMLVYIETNWLFEEVDRNVDKNIDIYEFMHFYKKFKLQINNPFRE